MNNKKLSITLIILFVYTLIGLSNTNRILSDSLFSNLCYKFPHKLKPFQFQTFIALSFVRLPYDWVESENSTTMINIATKIGLPANFDFEINAKATPSATNLRFGPELNIHYHRISIGVGFNAAYSYLHDNEYGYINKAYGWSAYPSLSLGYSHKNLAFTIVGELDFTIKNTITSEDIVVSQNRKRLWGRSIGIYLEQKIHRNIVMTIGFVNNFQKNYFTTWPVLTTFNRYYYLPQIYLGIVL